MKTKEILRLVRQKSNIDPNALELHWITVPVIADEEEPLDDYWRLDEIRRHMVAIAKSNNGCGLALPQLGISSSIFVAQDPASKRFKIFVNPRLLEYPDKNVYQSIEGCLSIPGKRFKVQRFPSIRLKYFTLDYADETVIEKEETFFGHFACIIQHEYDHLCGKLLSSFGEEVKELIKENI